MKKKIKVINNKSFINISIKYKQINKKIPLWKNIFKMIKSGVNKNTKFIPCTTLNFNSFMN